MEKSSPINKYLKKKRAQEVKVTGVLNHIKNVLELYIQISRNSQRFESKK